MHIRESMYYLFLCLLTLVHSTGHYNVVENNYAHHCNPDNSERLCAHDFRKIVSGRSTTSRELLRQEVFINSNTERFRVL